MRIYRSDLRPGFVRIPNETARDPSLSYTARGMLAEILSRPDDWRETLADIVDRAARERGGRDRGKGASESRRTLTAAWQELVDAGYIERVRIRGPDGKLSTDLHVRAQPRGA